jgi:ribosomal protein S18 acetylase RimI-like enzyme
VLKPDRERTDRLAAVCVRSVRRSDAARLVRLMRGLARFEGYLDRFAITGRELRRRAFGPNRECAIEVAEDIASGNILGYAVILTTPYTYDLKPTLTLKELYVERGARGRGVGTALMRAVAVRASALSAGRLRWDVLPGNDRAEAFYQALGGRRVDKWIPYAMDASALKDLVRSPPEVTAGRPRERRRSVPPRRGAKKERDKAR